MARPWGTRSRRLTCKTRIMRLVERDTEKAEVRPKKFGQYVETLTTLEYVKMIATFYAWSEWARHYLLTRVHATVAAVPD